MSALSGILSYGEIPLPATFTPGDGTFGPCCVAAADILGAQTAAGALDIYPATAQTGTMSPGFDAEYMGKILVVPRKVDCGEVLSDQTTSVEVYNGCFSARTLTAITVVGDSDITVEDLYGLPTHYPTTESRTYNVTVETLGAPAIDATVTWVFTGESGTDCRFTGVRIILFSPAANWDRGVDETIAYLTDVLTSWDGHEQRVQLVETPQRGLSYACLVHDPAELAYLQSILYAWGARIWGVPWWPEAQPLGADATAGAFTFTVDTTDRPAFVAGGMVALWVSTQVWECLEIQSVAAGSITTVTPCASAYTANVTRVIPVRTGRLPNDLDMDLLTPGVAEFSVRFEHKPEDK